MPSFNLATAYDNAMSIAMLIDGVAMKKGDRKGAHYMKTTTADGPVAKVIKKQFPTVRVTQGVYRCAAIFRNYVVKWSLRKNRQQDMIDEATFINEMRNDPRYARHFPETHCFKLGKLVVLVQERVKMRHTRELKAYEPSVTKLGTKLGIFDIHDGNYGWAGPPGKEWPVFIDVDFRFSTDSRITVPSRRSWEI